MILSGVGMLACVSRRTHAYLRALEDAQLAPAVLLLLDGAAGVDAGGLESVMEFCGRRGVVLERTPDRDPNAGSVVQAVAKRPEGVFIYSGPAGVILRRHVLATGKRFLHIHPGWLPDYRGSTTLYYSLLLEGTCGVSALFLDEEIDAGPIIRRQQVEPPEDRRRIDTDADPAMRAALLVAVLREYARTGEFGTVPQGKAGGKTYYIIHPVLKHLAILAGDRRSTSGDAGATSRMARCGVVA